MTPTALRAPEFTIRPIAATDRERLRRLFYRMSSEARYYRFHSPVQKANERWLDRATNVDHLDREALVAVVEDEIVGVARYAVEAGEPASAELAVVVADDWQRRGVATRLLRDLALLANDRCITRWTGIVIAENRAVAALLDSLQVPVTWSWDDGRRRFEVALG